MCLIFYKPAEVEFPDTAIRSSFVSNKDGFGLMFANKGRVQVYRTMPSSAAEVVELVKKYSGREFAGHMRLATSGDVNKKMCHPVKILHKDKDGADLYLMHNGVLAGLPVEDKKCSDTWHLAQLWIKPLLERIGPDWVTDGKFQEIMKRFIGPNNKLLFLDDSGRYTIINKPAGSDTLINGCWVSNPGAVRNHDRPSFYKSGSNAGYHGTGSYGGSYYSTQDKKSYNTTYDFFGTAFGWHLPPDEPTSIQLERPVFTYGEADLQDIVEMSHEDLQEFILQRPEDAADLVYDILNDAGAV